MNPVLSNEFFAVISTNDDDDGHRSLSLSKLFRGKTQNNILILDPCILKSAPLHLDQTLEPAGWKRS